jgi:hypothetical protein
MFSTTILAQSTPKVSTATVYEYSFALINAEDGDLQDNLTAAFTSIPSADDWTTWLRGWTSCGYSLVANPELINTI